MLLPRDRLGKPEKTYTVDSTDEIQDPAINNNEIGGLATRYRDRLIRETDLDQLINLPRQLRRTRVERIVTTMVGEDGLALSPTERDYLARFIVNEVVGLGPLEKLMTDPSITEIMVNGPGEIYIERNGKIISRPDVKFTDQAHIRYIIDRIISPLGRRIDESLFEVEKMPSNIQIRNLLASQDPKPLSDEIHFQ